MAALDWAEKAQAQSRSGRGFKLDPKFEMYDGDDADGPKAEVYEVQIDRSVPNGRRGGALFF